MVQYNIKLTNLPIYKSGTDFIIERYTGCQSVGATCFCNYFEVLMYGIENVHDWVVIFL